MVADNSKVQEMIERKKQILSGIDVEQEVAELEGDHPYMGAPHLSTNYAQTRYRDAKMRRKTPYRIQKTRWIDRTRDEWAAEVS